MPHRRHTKTVDVADITLALGKMTTEEICAVLRSADKFGTFVVTPKTRRAKEGAYLLDTDEHNGTSVTYCPF